MKKMLILLLLVSNLCQPAYGFSLNNNNYLFSSIKNFIKPYGTQLLETLSEHKTLFCGLAVVGAATFALCALKSHKNAKNEAERLEAERLEAERLEAERLEAERLEAAQLIDNPQNTEEYFFATKRNIATILEHPNRARAIAYTDELIDNQQDLIYINEANEQGYTPLMVAAKLGLKDLVHKFILLNADPCFINHHTGENALIYLLANPAIKLSHLSNEQSQVLEIFLDHEKISEMLHAENKFGNALIFATRLNDPNLVNTIYNLKPQLLNNTNNAGQTSLHIAISNGNMQIAQLLLEKGSDIEICDIHSNSPLKSAIQANHLDIAAWLMKEGIAFDKELYQVALEKAIKQEDLESIESLILSCSPQESNEARKIIFKKMQLNNAKKEIRIRQLLTLSDELYTDGNFIKKLALFCHPSNSAIIQYVQANNYEAIKDAKDTDFNAPNSWGLTPLIIATALDHHQCVKELLKKDADTNILLGNLSVEDILNNLTEQNLLENTIALYDFFDRKNVTQDQGKKNNTREKRKLFLKAINKRKNN